MRESEKVNYYAAFFEDKQHAHVSVLVLSTRLSPVSLSLSLCVAAKETVDIHILLLTYIVLFSRVEHGTIRRYIPSTTTTK